MRSMSCFAAASDVSSANRTRPTTEPMRTNRNDLAVMSFAVHSRDWRLVELLARLLGRERTEWLGVAHTAYLTLSARLGIGSELQ